jgi:hypothetical protein
MNLLAIKRNYDTVVSLGSKCQTAHHLKRHNLRTFSGPLDWVVSESLPDVISLLNNRFVGLMEPNNMFVEGQGNHNIIDENGTFSLMHTFVIKDIFYNITSMHDFPINQVWTQTYPAYKEKLNRRINRFLEKISNSQMALFVRLGASYHETVQLRSALSRISKGQFHILIVNSINGINNVIEKDWGIDGVCSVEIPDLPTTWVGDTLAWDHILTGVSLE